MSEDLRLTNLSGPGHNYTWEKKYEVVTQMLALGNQRLVAEISKVPYNTISAWKKQEWWDELVQQIKYEKTVALDSKLSKIIDKSLSVVEDRLENGEMVFDRKTQEFVRRPVVLKDASKAANDLLARQAIVRKSSEESSKETETMQETLGKLADEFAKFTKTLKKSVEKEPKPSDVKEAD